MPTRIPNGLYSGEAVVFNTQPYVQFYSQHLAQKQAKDEALDKYFSDQYKGLTPAGMRSQDIEGLTKKTGELQDFYQKNRDAIKNPRIDNGKSIAEYQSRHQDALGYIAKSKDRAELTKQLATIRTDPDKADRFTEDTIHNLAAHDLPLTDPNSKSFDLTSLTYNPKDFDAKAQEAYNRAVTMGLTPSEKLSGTTNLPNFQVKETYNKEYSPGDLKLIGERAGSFYTSDKSIKKYADSDLLKSTLNDPAKYNELNDIYKKVYGKDAHTPEELFKAQTILNSSRGSVTEKVVPDVFGREKAMQAIRQSDAKDLIALRKKIDPNDTEMNNTWVESMVGNMVDDAKSRPAVPYKYGSGGTVAEYDIPMNAFIAKSLSRNGREPTYIRYNPKTEQFRPVFPQRYEKGDKMANGKEAQGGEPKSVNGKFAVDAEDSQPMSLEQLKLNLGYKGVTKKQLGKEVLSGQKGAKVTTQQSAADKAEELLKKYMK